MKTSRLCDEEFSSMYLARMTLARECVLCNGIVPLFIAELDSWLCQATQKFVCLQVPPAPRTRGCMSFFTTRLLSLFALCTDQPPSPLPGVSPALQRHHRVLAGVGDREHGARHHHITRSRHQYFHNRREVGEAGSPVSPFSR